jgi:hypothetical protein
LRLYRVAFWRCIGRLGLFFYETDTPPRVYPLKNYFPVIAPFLFFFDDVRP